MSDPRRLLSLAVSIVALAMLPTRHSAVESRAPDRLLELEGRVRAERTAENLHHLALAQIHIGKTRAAAALLEDSARLDPSNITIAIDLALAQTANGDVADGAERLAAVLQREPENLTAAFHWALALERLANRPAAIGAWKRYLDLDPPVESAAEATRHLQRLTQQRRTWEEARQLLRPGVDRETVQRVVTEFPQRVRMRSQNVLLPAWAESGRPEELGVVRLIAEERAARDPYLLDIVINAEKDRGAVIDGLRAFAAGFAADNHDDTVNGILRYSEAAERLGRAGSPLAIGAGIYAASMAVRGGDTEGALTRLTAVDRQLAESGGRYPAMAAEAAWVQAIAFMQFGEMQRSLDDFRRAHDLATSAGEAENAAFIAAMIATNMELLIDPAEAVAYRTEALQSLDDVRADIRRLYPAYFEAGYTSLRNSRPRVGMAFLESAAEAARRARIPQDVAASSAQRAFALSQTGQQERAELTLKAARLEATQVADEAVRDRAMSQIEYVAGRIEMNRQPERALNAFRSAVAINQRRRWHIEAAAAQMGCGEAALAVGHRAEAEQSFRAAIAEMEHERRGLAESEMRIAYFERSDGAFGRLINLLLDHERSEEALTIAERKRARARLDDVAGSDGAEPLDVAAIVRGVGSGQALLELVLLDRGAEAWLVRDGHVTHGRSSASGAEIEQAVKRHLVAITRNQVVTARREGRWLYDQLIAPVARELPRDVDLVIAADGVLQSIPFATLVDGDNQYLIEQRAVARPPSASVLVPS